MADEPESYWVHCSVCDEDGWIAEHEDCEEEDVAEDPTYTPEPDAEELKRLGARLAAIGHAIEQDLEAPRGLAAELGELAPLVRDALLRRASNEYAAKEESER